ncbi:MAG: ribonuclease E inhibitor RraB [Balneolaceae bacterium]|nr:ribonuclease E inhibitor RraB [Balneolaceae bacterium]
MNRRERFGEQAGVGEGSPRMDLYQSFYFVSIPAIPVHTINNPNVWPMTSPKKQASNGAVDILQNLDADLNKKRPVTFWFYSDFEENLYRTAHQLQKDGYEIVHCDRSDISNDWLLIAEKEISPSPENIERLFYHFEDLAQQMEVTFDGWETRIEME